VSIRRAIWLPPLAKLRVIDGVDEPIGQISIGLHQGYTRGHNEVKHIPSTVPLSLSRSLFACRCKLSSRVTCLTLPSVSLSLSLSLSLLEAVRFVSHGRSIKTKSVNRRNSSGKSSSRRDRLVKNRNYLNNDLIQVVDQINHSLIIR
jgi:hypothetical protein